MPFFCISLGETKSSGDQIALLPQSCLSSLNLKYGTIRRQISEAQCGFRGAWRQLGLFYHECGDQRYTLSGSWDEESTAIKTNCAKEQEWQTVIENRPVGSFDSTLMISYQWHSNQKMDSRKWIKLKKLETSWLQMRVVWCKWIFWGVWGTDRGWGVGYCHIMLLCDFRNLTLFSGCFTVVVSNKK